MSYKSNEPSSPSGGKARVKERRETANTVQALHQVLDRAVEKEGGLEGL